MHNMTKGVHVWPSTIRSRSSGKHTKSLGKHKRSGGSSSKKGSKKVRKNLTKTLNQFKKASTKIFKGDEFVSSLSSVDTTVFVGKNAHKPQGKKLGHFVYEDNFGALVSSSNFSGTAAVSELDRMMDARQLINDVSTGISPNYNTYEPGLFALNAFDKTTGSSALNTVGSAAVSTSAALHLREIYTKYDIHNSTDYGQIVDVWHLVSKTNDINGNDPITIWNEGYTLEGAQVYSSGAVIPTGVTLTTTAGTASCYYALNAPCETYHMRRKFKVLKHKTFHMAGKSTVSYNVKTVYNKTFGREYVKQLIADSTSLMRNTTVYVLIKARGTPVYESDKAVVTAGPAELICTVYRKVKGYFLSQSASTRITAEAPNLYYANNNTLQKDINVQDTIAGIINLV